MENEEISNECRDLVKKYGYDSKDEEGEYSEKSDKIYNDCYCNTTNNCFGNKLLC